MAEQALALQEIDPIEKLIQEGAYRDAVTACVSAHGGAMGRLCMAMLGAQHEAEEVLQETFLAAFDGMASFRGDGSVRAWLFGIARRLCARRLEARPLRERHLRLAKDTSKEVLQPDSLLAQKHRAQRVRALLEELTPSEREALLLRYEAALSFREIGAACGIDEATARKRASRGLSRLRTLIQQEDVP